MTYFRISRLRTLCLLVGVFALIAAACGGADEPTPATEAPTAEAPTTEAPAAEAPAAEEPATEEPAAEEPATEEPAAEEPAAEEPAAEEPAVPGSELIIALTTQPNAIDGVNTAERNASNVSNQIFDPLVWINDDLEFEPALAESWTVSDDGLAYTFKLREDVVFHNGEPFNADAVVFSWEVQKQPENAYFNYYERASEVNKIDEYTVELVAPTPNALFLGLTGAIWFFVPPKYYAEVGRDVFQQEPIGTGPFMLTEWVQGDRIVLDRNPNYWRKGYPKLDRLIFRPITESSTRAAAIQTGEVDIVSRLSPDEAASLEGVDGVNVIEYPTNRVYYIAFNNLTSGVGQPTEDPRVRQALNHAVDVEGIIDALFNGNGARATGLMTAADFGYNHALAPYSYDPDRARELLAEAGYTEGFDIGFACPSDAYTNFAEVCEAVAAQLGEVGVNASLDLMESGAYWDLEAKKQLPPLFGDSWSNANPEGWDRLQGAMGGQAASYSAWSDPVVDSLLLEILATPDDNARADLYQKLQQQMYDEPPFIYLYVPSLVRSKERSGRQLQAALGRGVLALGLGGGRLIDAGY